MAKILAMLVLFGLVILPMVVVAEEPEAPPIERMRNPGCDQIQELILQGILPPDTPALNACEPHGGGHKK